MSNPTNIAHLNPVAPTPQNTPLQPTPAGLSRPHVPTTIGEDEETEDIPVISSNDDRDQIRASLANHPALAGMVQGRLQDLLGRSSGYVESLPIAVRTRVDGLKGIQAEHSKIEADFQKEILELEKQFAARYAPLYARRRAIIEGDNEPTKDEIEAGIAADAESDLDSDEEPDEHPVATPQDIAAAPKGIPGFWLTALQNHLGLSELITERDEECLKHLVDIRSEYLDGVHGFRLVFEFSKDAQDFFEDSVLTKTYYYQNEVGYTGDFVYDRAEGTDIKWKSGKDLTVKVETKKQRNKNTNQTRIVKKVVPTDSFFSFFKPPTAPEDDEDEDDDLDDDLAEKLELDYQIGEDIKERVIPRAVDFFTGKALRYEEQDDYSDDMDGFEDMDDVDEEDSDDDEPVRGVRKAALPPSGVTPASNQNPQECKQQ